MTPRATRIAVFLRHLAVRPLLAYELRGSVVQLLGPGTTDPTWTATPELLAEAIDADLTQAEEKDIPQGTPSTAHALVIDRDERDFIGTCQCGRAIGRTPQGRSVDGLVGLWEQHADQPSPDTAWANALASLPASSIGAS